MLVAGKNGGRKFHLLVILLLLLLPALLFWRPHFFFIYDSWTTLLLMVEHPFWEYLNTPEGEQWFPFYHLVYFVMIKISGDNYNILVLINSLMTGINAFLIYILLQRHLSFLVAALISLFYSVNIIHTSAIWHTFNICYIMSWGFFVAALFLTDIYLKKGSTKAFVAIGLVSLLSISSHNISVAALSTIPLYALLFGGADAPRKFWGLAALIALLYLFFIMGYFTFAGKIMASSHNSQIFSQIPGPDYLWHWFFGAFLYPSADLFGVYSNKIRPAIVALILLGTSIAIILLKGETHERRLGAWALALNALTFLPVALARYKLGVGTARAERYAIFTLMSILVLVSLAWQILFKHSPRQTRAWVLLTVFLALMLLGQFLSFPGAWQQYEKPSSAAFTCYQHLDLLSPPGQGEGRQLFCPQAHPWLTHDQAVVIKRFLRGRKNQS